MKINEKIILKILPMLVALMIMMPIYVMAENNVNVDVSTTEEFFNALKNENIVSINVMSDDIYLKYNGNYEVINVSGKTINLNNHTIKTDNMAVVFEGKDFIIKDGTFDAHGLAYGIFIGDEGETNNVTIENITSLGGFNIYNSSNVVIRNCNVTGNKFYAIWCDQGGQAVIESGNFKTNGVAVIGMSSQIYDTKLEIKGGTYLTNEKPLILVGKDDDGNDWGSPEIIGGVFDITVDEKYIVSDSELVEMTDGTFIICNHNETSIINKVKVECMKDGYTGDVQCSTCLKIVENGEVILKEGHKVVLNDRCEPSCLEDGYEKYYSCTKCNQKFKDENATENLSEIEIIKALGHTSSDWKQDEDCHWKECIVDGCKAIIEKSKGNHTEKDGICEICQYEMYAIQDIIDDETNIKLEYEKNVLPENINLEIKKVIDGDIFDSIKNVLDKVKKVKVFDINLLKDGVKVQPNGSIKITIPIPEDFDKNRIVVYRIDGTEKIEYEMAVVNIGDKDFVQFETNHFSYYVLAQLDQELDVENKLEEQPKTGEARNTIFMIAFLAISVVGFVICKKKICK